LPEDIRRKHVNLSQHNRAPIRGLSERTSDPLLLGFFAAAVLYLHLSAERTEKYSKFEAPEIPKRYILKMGVSMYTYVLLKLK
jgi:hypothetical protein